MRYYLRAQYDVHGREVADQSRMELPSGWERPETLAEQIRRMVRTEFSRHAEAAGFESFEQADDFEVDEDGGEFVSPYEMREMSPEGPVETLDGEQARGVAPPPEKRPTEAPEPVSGHSEGGGSPPSPADRPIGTVPIT